MELKGKNVLVFGAGKSGIGAAELLLYLGACPVLYDGNKNLDPQKMKEGLSCPEKAAAFTGSLPEEVIATLALAVLSPGVPTDCADVLALKAAGVPVIGEIELAWLARSGRVLGVTGTNGKTTTTSLLGAIMQDACPEVYIVGNIGNSFAGAVPGSTKDAVFVAELSSFQLETCDTFHPAVSSILNITEDHMNRHHTMAEYIRCKELITKNQTKDDVCVLNYEDPVLREFGVKECPADVFWFSSARYIPDGICMDGTKILVTRGGRHEILLDTDDLMLPGTHNHENVMAAAAMAIAAGVSLQSIAATCLRFKPVPHRIEFVAEKRGVAWYNDSKGTNPDAAIKGILAMKRPTLLIGGGYDKGSDYRDWIRCFGDKVKWFVLEGKTRFDIRDAALEVGFPEEKIVLLPTMREAMDFCRDHAEAGDAVLLSPACASWGEFPNYEVRGDDFKKYVREELAE